MNLRVLIIILYLHHNSHNEESVDVDVDMYVDMCNNKQQCIVIGLDQGGGRMTPNYNFHFISQSTVDI